MFRFAWKNLINRPVRVVLSILGLSVSVAGMVGLFAISGGIAQLVTQTFEKVPGILVQQQGAPLPLFSSLPTSWQSEIESLPGVSVCNPEVMLRVNMIGEKRIITPPRFMIGMEMETRLKLKNGIYNEHMVEGRFLTLEDQGTTHTVISRQIAQLHDLRIGSPVRVNGTELTVVGIYDCHSQLLDVNMLVDMELARRLARIGVDTVSCFYVEAREGTSNESLKTDIERLFTGRDWKASPIMGALNIATGAGPNPLQAIANNLDQWAKRGSPQIPATTPARPSSPADGPPSPSAVEVRTADDWAEQFEEFSGDLHLFLFLISTVGFLIAVLSILNTMLMSVMERTSEFGILRANGWTRGEVMRLIVSESAIVGIGGGVSGLLIGIAAAAVANRIWPERLHLYVSPRLACFAIAVSVCLGVAGGLYPAWKAARLSPMDAIRRA